MTETFIPKNDPKEERNLAGHLRKRTLLEVAEVPKTKSKLALHAPETDTCGGRKNSIVM